MTFGLAWELLAVVNGQVYIPELINHEYCHAVISWRDMSSLAREDCADVLKNNH